MFRELVQTADFLLDSSKPGYMDGLGIGYDALSAFCPNLIMVSLSPFGQTGPYAKYASGDLITWALGGMLMGTGFPDGEPLWFGSPQSKLNAASEAAAAALMALWCLNQSNGRGQHIDVSEQESVVWLTYIIPMMWDISKRILHRSGNEIATGTLPLRLIFPCKDGYVCVLLLGGGGEAFARSSRKFVLWMNEEGMSSPWLMNYDWTVGHEPANLTKENLERINREATAFLAAKTKAELYKEGFRRGILLAPVNNTADILQDEQLKSRDFWVRVEHPELKDVLSYCGPFAKVSPAAMEIYRRAPSVGEHNAEIYSQLGKGSRDLKTLQDKGII